MLNLLENAIDALSGSPGHPERGGIITLNVAPSPDRVMLEMSDTGPGIPEDLFDRVFTPFFTTKPNGSGLGLPVTRRIITDHGGQISLSKTDQGNTRFKIELPGWPTPAPEGVQHVANTGS
jgi:two-component system sensor kinase FixL